MVPLSLRVVARKKMIHYRQLYVDRPEPIAFMSVVVDTGDRIYDDFSRLLFLHAHREASALSHELPEESDQFRFLRAACLGNIKGSVGLILGKAPHSFSVTLFTFGFRLFLFCCK